MYFLIKIKVIFMYIYHLIEDEFEFINNMNINSNEKKLLKYEYLYNFVIDGKVINNVKYFLDSKLFLYYIFKNRIHKKYSNCNYYGPVIDKDFDYMKNYLIKKHPENKNIRFVLPTSYDDYLDTIEFFIGRNGRCFFF
tara:strand:+ start:722 stop:1135 length:414 start_codon:yes stop_codon:yes gene_type:complete